MSLCQSSSTSLSGLCDQYENVLSSILNNHAPLRTKTVKQRPVAPWFGNDIAVEKTKRRRLERRRRLTNNSADRDLYLNQRKLVKDMINSAKMRYYTSLIEDSVSDQNKLFRTIDQLLHRKSMKLYPSWSSVSELANRFANFFDGKITMIRQELAVIEVSDFAPFTALVIDTPQRSCELNTLLPTTVEELSEIMRFTLSKSCSLDPLPSKLVINNLDVLMPVICNIVNLSLDSSQVPTSMKEAVLQSLLKKPSLDHEIYKKFRPVSNLKMISKVTEKVAATRLNHYLEVNNLSELYQSAYKINHSCETALLRNQNDILGALDSNDCVALLTLGLSAAFDTVDHEILLEYTSSKFGIKDKAFRLV